MLAWAASIALLYYGQIFFITIITAVIIAFLLDPVVGFFMRIRLSRGVASFVVCSLAVSLLYVAGLGIFSELATLKDELPQYSDRISQLVDQAVARVDEVERASLALVLPRRLRTDTVLEQQAVKNKRNGPVRRQDPGAAFFPRRPR